ncbi:pyruvate formate lyase family protein [Evtepia gabavorous]|uniref:pyruvate formate lyase family protein n=1 Tax=Evtepia gabavorous TaxID=2211183 RepID=UPI003A8E73C1
MAVHTNATAGAALGNELRAGTVAQVGSTKRIQALNGMLHANRPNVDITRARAYTKIYKQTEGMPSLMRRYKASAEVYRTLSDNVYDHEQLVGWPTQKIRGANFAIELHAHWLAEDLPNLRERTYDPFDITDEDYRELEEELLPYWKDKTMAVQWGHYVSQREWNRGQFGGVSDVSNYLCANGSHFIPAWTDVIQHGFIKYYEKAQRLLEALDPNDPESIDKRIFYTGILEVLEAIRDWGERLSAACARRAREEKDPVRKQELENMAAMMKRVPWGPATSFHDACETAWAVCFFLFVEGAGPSITWGRFDQYMYPYYKEDIEKGILTPEKAMELIEELYVRVTSNVWFQSTQMAYIFGGYYRYPHLDVGGLDENGRDASNELSYLCLRAMRYAKTTSPAVSLLLHQKTPDSLLYEACELAAEGMGHPSFFNCEGLYSMLEHRAGGLEGYSHYTRKDILKFGSPIGCVEPGAEGLQYGHTDSGIINVAGAALMAVTNGVMPEESDNMFAGKLLTFESGAPGSFQTFEAFYDAVKAQIKYAIDEAHANLLICEKLLAEQFNLPTFTVLLEGALEKGKDATAGGAKVNVGPTMNMCGFGTMVDSVAAIKKVVFEDRAATLEEVCAACMQNFVGYEDLRTKLQAAPKYGNDDDFADAIAADLWKWFSTCTMRLKMYRGHYCDAAVQMVQSNVGYGAMTGATPNGRLAGMPLSDTMSATQQADTHGPTAAARSYGKLDFPAYTNGTLLNMWISQSELIEQS